MILNDGVTSYTFSLLPGNMTVIREDKSCASVQTYEGVAYFSWGTSIVGKELSLSWNAMPAAMWSQFETFFTADAPLEFDPTLDGTPSAKTYTVEMTRLDGDYFLGGYGTGAGSWRQNVTMTLLILSEVP